MQKSNLDLSITPHFEKKQINLINKLTEQLDHALDNSKGIPIPVAQTGILEKIGKILWKATGINQADFLDAIEDAQDNKQPLRIIIKGSEYYNLPWELLYHENPEIKFVGCNSWCTIVRRFQGKGKNLPQKTPGPLKILLFISSPDDLDPHQYRLDFDKEQELLFTALDQPYSSGKIDIDVAEDGTLETLINRMENNTYHAVILSMHGTSVKDKQKQTESVLLFEDNITWKSKHITGTYLAEKINNLSSNRIPGLFVISACGSAKSEQTAQAITDITGKLHKIGIERVIGMRLSVQDRAASVFSAEIFKYLAQGEILGRALSLARNKLAIKDDFAQWSIPVLLDRTSDGPILDITARSEIPKRPPIPDILIGDRTLSIPSRQSFIGRRAEIRSYLRPFLENKTPCLMLTGPGGVGKTTLAGLFARYVLQNQPNARIIGFGAPFDLNMIYEPLRDQAFDGNEHPDLHSFIQTESDIKIKIHRLILSLVKRDEPLVIILDNLESLQKIETLELIKQDPDSLWFVKTVCSLPFPARVLLTGRYSLPESMMQSITLCRIKEAPFGDVLYRMKRLNWPENMGAVKKKEVYAILGGNHRAIEWAAQLISDAPDKAEELTKQLEKIKAPINTRDQILDIVVEAMRQNLLFSKIRDQLGENEDRLVQAACLFRVPVNQDGLIALNGLETEIKRLVDYALLDVGEIPGLDLEYYSVPAVIKQILGETEFSQEELKSFHFAIAKHHEFQAEFVTREWQDDIEAIFHFRKADEHINADKIARSVCNFYYQISNFTDANKFAFEILERKIPPPPWWALNRYGMCQLVLGFPDKALDAFKQSLLVVNNKEDKGATLNNISQIYDARGDYETALKYLEQSLEISCEIGNRSGEGATLSNMAAIAYSKGDYKTALKYFEQSLDIKRQSGDKSNEGTILNNISQIYDARGDYETALKYLEQSLEIIREIGDKSGEGTTLNNMSTIAYAQGDYETALKYLEQSLQIIREIGDKSGEGTTLNNISQIFKARGDYETALKYLEQSLEIRREIGDKSNEGTTLNNMSTIAYAKGDYETALKYLEQSLEIIREIGDKSNEGTTLNNISQIYDARGDYETALKYLEQSLEIIREIGDKSGEGTTLNNISQIYDARGDYETALKYLEQSLEIIREIGDKSGMIATLNNMAQIALESKDIQKAIQLFTQALTLAKETQDAMGLFHVSANLGILFIQIGNKDQGKQLLEQAVNIGNTMGIPDVKQVQDFLNQIV